MNDGDDKVGVIIVICVVLWLFGFFVGTCLTGPAECRRKIFVRRAADGAPQVLHYEGVYYECRPVLDLEKFVKGAGSGEESEE